jgi:hypothetical protein
MSRLHLLKVEYWKAYDDVVEVLAGTCFGMSIVDREANMQGMIPWLSEAFLYKRIAY